MFRLKSIQYWLGGLLALLGILSVSLPAQAFTVAPARLTITVEGGSAATVKVTVSNPEASAIAITPRVVGVKQDEQGRTLLGKEFDEAEGWVQAEASSVRVPAGGKREVVFSVVAPFGTAPGSHYVGLALAAASEGSGTVQLTGELVSLLTIQVAGVVNERLEIIEWKVPRLITAGGFVPATIVMSNTGTIEVPLAGQVAITSLRGREIFSGPLPLGNKLLALSTRRLEQPIDVPSGSMSLGLYRASLRVTYGLTQQTVVRSAFIWFVPIWSLGIAGVFLLGFMVFIVSRHLRSAQFR